MKYFTRIVIILFLLVIVYVLYHDYHLRQIGIQCKAKVDAHYHKNKRENYEVTFKNLNGQTIKVVVPSNYYFDVGDSIDIIYDPNDYDAVYVDIELYF